MNRIKQSTALLRAAAQEASRENTITATECLERLKAIPVPDGTAATDLADAIKQSTMNNDCPKPEKLVDVEYHSFISEKSRDILDKAINDALREVYDQREEILKAFVAKHGFDPDRAVQIEQRMPDGSLRWFIRQRTDEEVERDNKLGI